ncbi:MAG TPA: KTSC domain-containing protein [Verrucomicrobiae bacterium]|nr:KTSC domain-containing protein [Verrucomicrobiae bacterium]
MQPVKMVPVDADLFEAIGYVPKNRQLYIRFRNSPALGFDNVPGFRFEGLLNAPRKDAYYRTFIKDRFLTKPVELPPPG